MDTKSFVIGVGVGAFVTQALNAVGAAVVRRKVKKQTEKEAAEQEKEEKSE